MENLSTGAWFGLLCLGGVVLTSALVLWSAWRQRNSRNPSGQNPAPDFTRTWREEDEKLHELSERVKSLARDNKDST